jgi:hypothetical protein
MVLLAEEPGTVESGVGLSRYFDLLELGFSPETSRIVADAPVSLEALTSLLLPDGE